MDEYEVSDSVEIPVDLRRRLDQMGRLLHAARAARHSLTGLGDPAPLSHAAKDHASLDRLYGNPHSARRAYVLADVWLMEASYDLGAIGTLYKSFDVTFGPLPLARVVLEIAARVTYILDPSIGHRQRAARATIEEAYSLQELRKAEKRINGAGSDLYGGLRKRMTEIAEEAAGVFGSGAEGNPHQWKLEGQELITPTEAVERFGAIQDRGRTFVGIYDRLSTHSHPGLGSTLFLDRADDGSVNGLTIRGTDLEDVAQNSLAFFHIALNRFVEYSGWQPVVLDQLNDQIEEVFPDFFAE